MLTRDLFRPVGASLREGRSPALRSPAVRLTRRGGRPASRTTRMRSRSGPGQYWERIRSNIVLERWFCLLIKCEVRQKHSNGLNIPVLHCSTVRDEKSKTFCFSRFQKGMNRREKALSGKSRVSHSVHCPYYTDDKQEFW